MTTTKKLLYRRCARCLPLLIALLPVVGVLAQDAGSPEAVGGEGDKGLLGGIQGIVDMLAAGGGGSTGRGGAMESESDAKKEQLRKVNELRRYASNSIVRGRVEATINHINELISVKPYDPDYHLALGLTYRRQGNVTEALRKYSDVLDLGGDKALVALLRAEAYSIQGKRDKVFENLKESAIAGRNIFNDVRTLKPLAGYQNDTEFIKLALSLEKVIVDVNRLKDPFTNPFPRERITADDDFVDDEDVVLDPEDQEDLLEEAKRTLERVRFYIKLEDEGKAMSAYIQLQKLIGRQELLTIPGIMREFRALVQRMPSVEVQIEGIRLKYYYQQAQDKLRRMKEVFVDGDYGRVAQIHNEVIRLGEEMHSTNPEYQPVARRILEASNRWYVRANVHQEFETLRPQIQGIIISDEGRMAVLDDRVIKQGEFLDDLRIVRVESNKITFRYKGEEIPVVFRRY